LADPTSLHRMASIPVATGARPLDLTPTLRAERAEREGRESQALFAAVLEGARSAMAILDGELRYTHCNPFFCRLLGVEPRRLLGRRIDEAFDLAAQPEVVRSLERLRESGSRAPTQVEYQFAGGDFPWVRERRTPIFLPDGGFHGIVLAVERLDRERFAESSLAALRHALDRTGEIVLELRRDGHILDANESALGALGYSREQITGMHLAGIDGSLGEGPLVSSLPDLFRDGAHRVQGVLRTAGGGRIEAEIVLQRIEHGEREFLFLLARDTSGRRHGERALAEAQARLDTLFRESPNGLLLLDAQFRIERANRAAGRLLGEREADLVGRDPATFLHPDDLDASLQLRQRLVAEGTALTESERRLRGRDGRVATANLVWRPLGDVPGGDGGAPAGGHLLMIEDLTERLAAEQREQSMQAESRLVFDTALVGLLFVRDGRVLRANAAMEELLGCEPGTLVEQIQLFAHPSDRLLLSGLAEHFEGIRASGTCEFEMYLYRRRGDPIWVAVQGRAVSADRPELGHIFAFVNIDQRKRADRETRAAVNELRLIFDNALVSILFVAGDFVIKANAAAERLFGFGAADLGEQRFSTLFEDAAAWQRVLAQCSQPGASGGASAGFELPMRRPGREPFWCAGNVRPIEPGAIERGVIVAITDVDARHRYEEELRQVRNHLDLVIESLPVLVSVREAASGRFVSINRAGELLTGLARDEVIGRTWHELYGRQFADLYAGMDRKAIALGGQIERPRDLMLRADGRTLTVHQRVVPIIHDRERGEPAAHYVMSIIDDLTGEVRAENALRETETRFRQFAENIDQVVFIAGPDLAQVLYVNDRYGQIVGGSVDELLSDPRSSLRHVLAADRACVERELPRLIARLRHGRRAELTVRVEHPDAGVRVLLVRFNPGFSPDGSLRVFGIADDVTERRAREQQRLHDAVRQRDVLVREVHHRIKNNLQGVAGLLQQMASGKPEVASTLHEIAGQIQAIAQVHGLQIGGAGTLPVLGVAQGIFSNLGSMFGAEVRLETDGLSLWRWGLPENEAVPIALVVNELGTNAIKYRTDRSQPIDVHVGEREGTLVLRIENEGVLPPGFDFEHATGSGVSGLTLIRALLPRRGASLRITQEGMRVCACLELAEPAIREERE
jgi:PAS domain S-box-containing protein